MIKTLALPTIRALQANALAIFRRLRSPQIAQKFGEVAEWLKAHAWKVCLGLNLTRVRIPLSPPNKKAPFLCQERGFFVFVILCFVNTIELKIQSFKHKSFSYLGFKVFSVTERTTL